MIRSLSLLSMLVFVSFNVLLAQWGAPQSGASLKGKITGTIIDSVSNLPVEFATIALRVKDTDKDLNGGISGSKGQFKLSDVMPGEYDLMVSFIGYATKKVTGVVLTKKKPDADIGTVFIRGDDVVLDEIKVTGEKNLVENRVDRIVYNAEQDVSTRGGDASDVLRKVPMLSVDVQGNVSLRGSQQVRILLNGKPSGMFSNNVADALRMFPADQIKSVEVITTPGAKYDAEGTGGIINIITKKKSVEGYSGSLSAAVGTRQNRGSLNLNAAKGRFGLNGSAGAYYSWPQDAPVVFEREDRINDGIRSFDQEGITNSSRLGFWAKAGAFYDINAYNSINSNFFLRGHSSDRDGYQDAIVSSPLLSMPQIYRRATEGGQLRSGYDWTTDYTRKYEDPNKEFSIAIQLSGTDSEDNNFVDQTSQQENLIYRENQENDGLNVEATFQVDYTHPLSKKVKWEVGGKVVLRDIDSEYFYDDFDFTQGVFVRDRSRSNVFGYRQDVFAAYSSLTMELPKDFSLVAGGRFERTTILGDFVDGSSGFENDYENFVPSIIFSKKFGFKTVKVSYVKRIQRPSMFYINPFVNSADPRNISFGNPSLAPEIAHQFDVGYTSFKRGTVLATSIYYRKTNDVIQTLLQVRSDGVSQTSFENLGQNNAVGANLFTSFTLKKFWTVRSNLDANYFDIKSNDQRDLSNSGMAYKLFVNSSFSFENGIKVDLFGFYNSPRFTLQGRIPSFSMMSVGASKEIWKKRGSIGITIIDPFFEYKSFETELSGQNFYQRSDFSIPFRSFGINFSYRFGKLDFKSKSRDSKIKNTDLKSGGDSSQTGGSQTGN